MPEVEIGGQDNFVNSKAAAEVRDFPNFKKVRQNTSLSQEGPRVISSRKGQLCGPVNARI